MISSLNFKEINQTGQESREKQENIEKVICIVHKCKEKLTDRVVT